MKRALLVIYIVVILFGIGHCDSDKKMTRITIQYTNPYYVVNLLAKTQVYSEPDDKSDLVYQLEKYRIVKMLESVSLSNEQPIWYLIEESDFKGYAVKNNFKIFNTLKEAESFLLDRHPAQKLAPSLSVYQLAEKDFQNKLYNESLTKLFRFLQLKDDFEQLHPIIYFSTNMLISQLYLKQGEASKNITHLEALSAKYKKNKEIELFGNSLYPEEIRFYLNDINKYLSQEHYRRRSTLLKWEISFYLGLAYEMEQKVHQAKTYYMSLLDQDKNLTISEQNKIPYINLALDHLIKLTEPENQLTFLESIKNKLDWKGSGRYFLFRTAEILAKHNSGDLLKTKKLAITYYQDFISLFNTKYKNNTYPGELTHYLKAKEQIQVLQQEMTKESPQANKGNDSLNQDKQSLEKNKNQLPEGVDKTDIVNDEISKNKSLDHDKSKIQNDKKNSIQKDIK